MKKHKIIVADSSYTIRRILELSFEDEESIEITTFESGEGLTEKIEELLPEIVIIDIKLPVKTGYEICEFINNQEKLKDTMVFLMRGGFEAVDDEKLNTLKYQEIISKPFDSTEVIEKIKGCLFPGEKKVKEEDLGPAPDDIPEIDDIDGDSSEDISFSDVKDEIESEAVPADEKEEDEEVGSSLLDVEPSEERTQSSDMDEKDNLVDENKDELENPFKQGREPTDKVDIDEGDFGFSTEEKDLEITSDGDETDEFSKKKAKLDEVKQIDGDEEMVSPEEDIEQKDEKIDPPVDMDQVAPETAQSLSNDEVQAEAGEDQDISLDDPKEIKEDEEIDDQDISLDDSKEFSEKELNFGEEDVQEAIDEDSPLEDEELPEDIVDESEAIEKDTDVLEDKIEEPSIQEKEEEIPEDELKKEAKKDTLDEMDFPDISANDDEKIQEDLDKLKQESVEPKPEPQEVQIPDEKIPSVDELGINRDQIINKIENKLEITIKEILWEVIPPLAEKIISKEINEIKSKIDDKNSE